MPINEDSRPTKVVGERREHPAIQRLARACIALARWRRGEEKRGEASEQANRRQSTGGEA